MRKTFIFLVTLGLLAGFASTARADYSISLGYNTGRTYSGSTYNGRNTHYPRAYRHYPGVRYNQRHYTYYPYSYYPVIVQKRVVYQQEKQVSNDQERFGISDVIVLSKAGLSDEIIIEKIRRTGSVFDLSAEEVEVLRKEGVSARVVNYMLNTNQ